MKQKIARYIERNCSLSQEFHYAHPSTKISLNTIYNCHFSGSQVWNIFSPGSTQFESTYNRSLKIMADLPYQTHRYLMEPLAGTRHMKIKLIKNYLDFIKRIKTSSKPVLRQLYSIASKDVRTVTGSNLRNILLLTDLANIEQLQPGSVDSIFYHKVVEKETWRINMMKELLDLKHGNLIIPDEWSSDELDLILKFVCTQ